MLGDTIEALRASALDADDALGYFPALYARVTLRIEAGAQSGRFTDGDSMERFARAFAGWYLGPMGGSEPLPGCWRATRDVAADRRLLVVQHLLLGINAHVNHDLPQVVVQVAEQDGRDLPQMRGDFDAVNQVLAETMPEVVRDLGRVSAWVNGLAARWGSRLFEFSLETARDQAWRAAVTLHALDSAERAAHARQIDELVCTLAYLVTSPSKPAGMLLGILRRLEENDPAVVTRRLLGPLA